MSQEIKIFFLFINESIASDFKRICEKSGVSTKAIPVAFMKDYIVSNGHPEKVIDSMPRNKKRITQKPFSPVSREAGFFN